VTAIGRTQAVQRHDNVLQFQSDQATLELAMLGPRVVHVRLILPNQRQTGQTVALPPSDGDVPFAVEESDPYVIRTAALVVRVDRPAQSVVFHDASGAVLLTGLGFTWERISEDRCRVQARFRRATEEHYYGLGQAGPSLDKDGTTRRLWNSHYGYGPGTDMAVPLVVSSRGYGLFFDNSWDAEVAIGRTEQTGTLVYTAEGGQVDFYFLGGPEPARILEEYAALTGFPPMPPRWALGYIQSTRHFESADEIVELAQTLRDKRIPCDAIVFLSTYGDDMGMNNGVGTLEFHPRLWADSGSLLHALKARNVRVVSHEYPVISPKSGAYEEAARLGYLVDYRGSSGSVMFNEGQQLLDFSNPQVGPWWWAQHQALVDAGVDGWWLDGGEGPPSGVQLHADSGQALHNVFDFFRQRAFSDGERRSRPKQRPWLLCRSGYAGMQRFGSATWSGDIGNTFDVFEAQLPLALSTAMSGVPYWGSDIGGFFHTVPESAELFVRWFQFAAFCPVFRSHGRGIGPRGWREHLPWAHGVHSEDVCRDFARLRNRLFPYNYTLAWQAHTHGTPLMRPLVLEFPQDPEVVGMSSEFMWGPSLLVAPVTRGGALHWPVYLPTGTWYDFWTHTAFDGGGWIEAPAPLEQMPVFVRAGAILPFGPDLDYLAQPQDGSLHVLIYPADDSAFELYDDDGETWAYEQDAYTLTRITCSARSDGLRVVLGRSGHYASMPAVRAVRVQIYMPSHPSQVTMSSEGTWSHDGERFLWLTLSLGSEPIEIDVRAQSAVPGAPA
jgi:alpha-glucosidase (family GH31 glycosyl hydrolase)